jgi:uncharacterized membrane protein YhhN
LTLTLSLAALLCGIIHIVADHRRAWITTWWSKPATMLAIVGVACAGPGPLDGYGRLIVFGLACSLVGDVFLMLRPARFVAGLVAFFFAHVIYIVAFTGRSGPGNYGLAVLLAGLGVAIYAYLRPGLGTLRLPVLAYVAAIVTMVWTAVTAWTTHGGPGAAAAAAGALFFLASDTSLGIARFRHRYPGAQAVTLGTYYLGQWLIALSAGPLAAVR